MNYINRKFFLNRNREKNKDLFGIGKGSSPSAINNITSKNQTIFHIYKAFRDKIQFRP